MNKLIYVLFISIFLIEYLADNLQLISRIFTLLPEALSGIILVIVVLRMAASKSIAISPKYIFLILMLGLHILAGLIINTVQPGAIVGGFRIYFKYIPLFLLPAVYDFSDVEIKKILKLILFFSVIQFPVAIYQRIIESAGSTTGDFVRGTLNTSSTLSIYLICAVTILLAFFLRQKIGRNIFLVLLLVLFLPTALNETKGTFILLPFALLTLIFFLPSGAPKFKQLSAILLVGVILASIFIPTYDRFMEREGAGILDFYTTEEMLKKYLVPQTTELGTEKIGRVDAVIIPINVLSYDPVKLMVGLGIGNVSSSSIKIFEGEYMEYNVLIEGAMSHLLWEVGILGVFFILLYYFFIFSDARKLTKRDDICGSIAFGWTAVVAVLAVSLFYNDYLSRNVIGYLFWFFSGYLAAKHYRMVRQIQDSDTASNNILIKQPQL